jgi:hypothetical protein
MVSFSHFNPFAIPTRHSPSLLAVGRQLLARSSLSDTLTTAKAPPFNPLLTAAALNERHGPSMCRSAVEEQERRSDELNQEQIIASHIDWVEFVAIDPRHSRIRIIFCYAPRQGGPWPGFDLTELRHWVQAKQSTTRRRKASRVLGPTSARTAWGAAKGAPHRCYETM